jgi:hypothetical protein
MPSKTPVVLMVLVETSRLRWLTAALRPDGEVVPLLRSEEGDLAPYVAGDAEQQLTFLRHRLCGVLQRGCDRLWARELKPSQFVVLFSEPLDEGDLTQQVADHFDLWLVQPTVVVYAGDRGAPLCAKVPLRPLAGELDPSFAPLLSDAVAKLIAAARDDERWELSRKKN